MKASTALFASVVAICCTINLVTGQIHFADGTSQSTAYTGQAGAHLLGENGYYIPGDAAFTFHVNTVGTFNTSGTVPMGQELVVLKCLIAGRHGNSAFFSTVADGGGDPILITELRQGYSSGSGYSKPGHDVYDFNDGTFVIDEGRYLELVVEGSSTLRPFTIFGYYRYKEPDGGDGGP